MKYGNVTLGQVEAVWNILGGEKGVQRLLAREVVVTDIRKCQIGGPYAVAVDYNRSFQKMVEAGRYVNVAMDIERFGRPTITVGRKHIDIMLVDFERPITTDEAIALMKKENLLPATARELLALGAQEPFLQWNFKIVALDGRMTEQEYADPQPYFLALGTNRGKRFLGVFPDQVWHTDCRFAFIPEPMTL